MGHSTIPTFYHVIENTLESEDVFTLKLAHPEGKLTPFLPGQFNMLYQFGVGESAISISGDPLQPEVLCHTIRAVGPVTHHLKSLKKGEQVGVRGPFGQPWPINNQADKHIMIMGGGIGLAPLRPLIYHYINTPSACKSLTILIGARTPEALLFQAELQHWRQQAHVHLTVDNIDNQHWADDVGVITHLIPKALVDSKNTLVFMCGPEVMMRFCLNTLLEKQVAAQNIYLSLERNMQCGTGQCGHCLWGPYFVCKDGPIFNYQKIAPLLYVKEL